MSTVRLEMGDDGVGVVTLDRPEALNIYNLAMRDELIEAFTAVRDDPGVRSVLLTASGRHFSAGADLSEFGTAESIFAARRIRWRRDPWLALLDSDKPSVVALHGYALGAGFEMALMCDFRLASPDAVVGLPETKLGMLPSAGGSQTLARLVGPAAALPVVMGAENLGALEALERGLVHRVVEDVDAAGRQLAAELADLDPQLVAAAKACLRVATDLPLASGLLIEAARRAQLGGASSTTS